MKKSFEDLVELSKFLRSPEGCPWDREQTLNTLRTFILEEAHEVIQAIDMNDIEEIKEELGELQKAISSNEQNSIEKEWGDLVFSLVNLARFLKIDAEVSAHKAIDVFIERFNRIEEKAKDMDKTLSELTLKEMDGLWEEGKREG